MARAIRVASLLAVLALAGCETPAPDDYVGGKAASPDSGVSLGSNAAGESCTQLAAGASAADIYCGAWQQPSAHVRAAGPADRARLPALATDSPWRSALNDRYACGDPTATTVLDGQPAVLMQCARRQGGWPHVAIIASINGAGWYGEGVLPALPAIERSIGIMSGHVAAGASSETQSSGADALLAERLAARAFSSGDVGQYEQLMAQGTRENQAERFPTAEKVYRAALALQEKALGAGNPNTVTPLTLLALQVSNQGRYAEADALFARAESLVAGAEDRAAEARLLHYRALHDFNQGKYEPALTLLKQAEASYASRLPPEILNARPEPTRRLLIAANVTATAAGAADILPTHDLLLDLTTRASLLGVVETRRYEAIVLRAPPGRK
jgi:tetratricopeptide (TPR) repeat protein